MAERAVVVRETGVRFSPFAFSLSKNNAKEIGEPSNTLRSSIPSKTFMVFGGTKNSKRIFVDSPFASNLLNLSKEEKMNILFMCRANCFRSRVAEAYLKKISNKGIQVKSVGIIPGYLKSKNQIRIAKKFGIDIKGKSRGITKELLLWADIFVIVADDVPPEIFDYEKRKKYIKKMLVWNVKDANSKDSPGIKRSIKQLIKKTEELNRGLN